MKSRWTLESIDWAEFQPDRVDKRLLALAKAASLVEANAADYVKYLVNVFPDDDAFHDDIRVWGEDERRHGAALRRWAEMADPTFAYENVFQRFTDAYHIPISATESVRGSQAQELVARCVVETGTSLFYMAMRDACQEPVLREICRRIAGDETRHYRMFFNYLENIYLQKDGVGLWGRTKTVLQRALEVSDQELAFAYAAANTAEPITASRRVDYIRVLMAAAVPLYKVRHFDVSVNLLGKAAGLELRPWMSSIVGEITRRLLMWRYRIA